MSMSVNQLAADTGLTVDQILQACRQAGVSAWGPTTILLDGDLNAIYPHLGIAPPAPPPTASASPPGAPLPPPGQPMPPPGQAFGAPPPPVQPFGGPPPPGQPFGAPPPPGQPFGAPMAPPGYVPPGYAVPGQPPKRSGSRTRTALIAVGIVVALIIGLGVIGAVAGDPDDGESVLDRLPDILGPQLPDFEVGDCFDDNSDLADVTGTSLIEAQVEQVPCSGTHDAEVFFVFDHPAPDNSPYPGDSAMFDTAINACLEEFEAFVGAPYETSALDIYFLAPSPEGFSRLDERKITCAVVNLDTTPLPGGTQRGSGR